MKDKVGREFDAFITGVAAFGVFVTLKDFFVEGLVPVSALGEDFFVYEEKHHRLRGRSGGKVYRLGDSLRVELKAIDEVRRRLDFRLAHAAPARAAAGYGRRARRISR
jgi:ribonuclease R